MLSERDLFIIDSVRRHTWPTMTEYGVRARTPQGTVEAVAYDAFCCVAATRLALDVLREHMIFGRALKVQVLTANRRGLKFLEEHGFDLPPDTPLPERAFLAKCGFAEKVRDGWMNGHAVAILDQEVLLDTSAPQFSNLNHGMLVSPMMLRLPPEAEWGGEHWIGGEDEDTGAHVFYRPHPDLDGLYDAPDWQARNLDRAMFQRVVAQKVRDDLARMAA